MSIRTLIAMVALLASPVTYARDLIIHIDFRGDSTMTRDIPADAFRDQLEAFNPGYEILSLKLSGASQRGRAGDLQDNVRSDLAKGLDELLREHSGRVAKLVLDADGVFGYIHHLGSVGGLGPGKDEDTLAEALAPLKGRMAADASVVLTAGRVFYTRSQDEFVNDVRSFLNEMGAPRGSLFAMSSLWASIPSWKDEYLRTVRILGSGFLGGLIATQVSGGDFISGTFAGLGVPLLYLASWPLHGDPRVAASSVDRKNNSLGALGALAGVLAVQTAFDPKLALTGIMISLSSYAYLTVVQFLMVAVPKINSARRGNLNTGAIFSLGEAGQVRAIRLRADKAWRRLFTCESELNEHFSGRTLDVQDSTQSRPRLHNVR